MSDETPTPEPVAPQQSPQQSPQQRLQQLRSIPEKDRKDAEWDEMNELEIMLASQNRIGGPDPNIRRDQPKQGGQRPQHQGQQQRRGGGGGGGQQPGGQPGHRHQNRQNRGRPR